VFGGTLNLTQSINPPVSVIHVHMVQHTLYTCSDHQRLLYIAVFSQSASCTGQRPRVKRSSTVTSLSPWWTPNTRRTLCCGHSNYDSATKLDKLNIFTTRPGPITEFPTTPDRLYRFVVEYACTTSHIRVHWLFTAGNPLINCSLLRC